MKRISANVALLAVTMGTTLAVPALAGDWRVTPRVSLSETYSDNVDLAPSGQEDWDLVTQLTGGVGLSGSGNRLDLNFDYQATGVYYANGSNGTRLDNRLQTNGLAELYEDHLFLDFSGSVSQRNINNQGRLTTNTVTGARNLETTAQFQASPYWRQRIGSYADTTTRYRGGLLGYSQSSVNTNYDEFSFSAVSGSNFAKTPWTLVAQYQRQNNSDGQDNIFRKINGTLSYDFTRQYGLRFQAGYENDSVGLDSGDEKGFIWGITGIWRPTSRTNLEAGYLGQTFGNSFYFSGSHRMRKTVIDLSYNETRTTTAQNQFARELFALTDPFGEPIPNPGTQDVFVPIDEANVTSETFISKRLSGGLHVQGRRTRAGGSVYYDKRHFEQSGQDETVYGLTVTGNRTLSRQSGVNARGYYQNSDFSDGTNQNTYGFNLNYNRTFSPDMFGRVGYSFTKNDSDVDANDYTENSVTASLTVLF